MRNDYVDTLERELVAAGERLGSPHAGHPRGARRSRRATGAAAVAFILVGGGAFAATEPWRPDSIRTLGAQAPPVSRTAAPADQRKLLEVLRRPAVSADRTAAVDRAVRFAGSVDSTTGVRTEAIRALGASADGPVVLVPLADWQPDPMTHIRDALCVLYPDIDGASKSCWTTADVVAGRSYGSQGTATYGLVPDGVASVSILFASGPSLIAHVENNFFQTVGDQGKGAGGKVAAIGWFDAHDNPVGP